MKKIYLIQIKDLLVKDDNWETVYAVTTMEQAWREVRKNDREAEKDAGRQIDQYGYEITKFRYRFEETNLFED